MIVDGGAGQLAAALAVLAELDLATCRGRGRQGPGARRRAERFFLAGREPFALEPRDPVLYFIQRLRDEAHRFAIGTHRGRRAQTIGRSELDRIPGIGAKRKQALLRHFGSARHVGQAGLADLEQVPGIDRAVARAIHDHFHESR